MPLSNRSLQSQLREKEGHCILYVHGSPFQMGFQHGLLLRDQIQQNIQTYLKTSPYELLPKEEDRRREFLQAIPTLLRHIPEKYIEEMQGVAEGSQTSFQDILLLNLFPEMFHCCVVTASGAATKDRSLYHARVLDYSAGKGLQSSAVFFFVTPQKGHSFMNVTYAGFIGCVTGMNEEKIAIGEIGGQGYGKWQGVPMSFLLRSLLEETSSLEEAKKHLSGKPRTCEYYYVVSDGKTQTAFSCYATDSQIRFWSPGQSYSLSPDLNSADLFIEEGPSQNPSALFFPQPKDTALLTGFSSPERYPVLLERIESNWGNIDEHALMKAIERPVSKESNLHNAIFHPSSLTVWVAHAGVQGEPASTQKYVSFSYQELRELFF